MRLALAIALMMTAAAPAQAGVRASYTIAEEARPLVIEVADNGDASVSLDGKGDRVLVTGGHAYAVVDGDEGIEVVRFTDVTRALRTTGTPKLDEPLPAMPAVVDIQAVPAGARTVAGVPGTLFRLKGTNGVTLLGKNEFVASTAPELRPISQAIGVILAEMGGIIALFDRNGADMARWVGVIGRLATLGAPLEWDDLCRIRSLQTVRIPPETIALPSAPISPDRLIARVRAESGT